MALLRTVCFLLILSCGLFVAAVIEFDLHHTFSSPIPPPTAFPSQFHANISTVAHLIDEKLDYPPRERLMEVWYDADAGMAKVFVHRGFEANKTFLRRWDTQDEYCIRADEFAECRRAFMTEPMANQSFPRGFFRRREGSYPIAVDGGVVDTVLWVGVSPEGLERVKYYVDRVTWAPVRISTEFTFEGRWDKVMSWTVQRLVKDDLVASDFAIPDPWTHAACRRVIGGWPQFHLFSHYLRV